MGALETRPESVHLVGLGPSHHTWVVAQCSKNSFFEPDEIWGVNTAINAHRLDKVFVMDDLKLIEEDYPRWAGFLKRCDTPILTCKAYPEWPTSIDFPLREVLDCVRDDVFTNSVAYALGYALLIGVKEFHLYGCDFWYPHAANTEAGQGAVSYLLGIARERGMMCKVPDTSTLLDCNLVFYDEDQGKHRRKLYGYDYNPGRSIRSVEKGEGDKWDKVFASKVYHEGLNLEAVKGNGSFEQERRP